MGSIPAARFSTIQNIGSNPPPGTLRVQTYSPYLYNFISTLYNVVLTNSTAAVNTLVTLVLIELLGAEKLADAFGWLNFFGGVGYVSGPVVAGW